MIRRALTPLVGIVCLALLWATWWRAYGDLDRAPHVSRFAWAMVVSLTFVVARRVWVDWEDRP